MNIVVDTTIPVRANEQTSGLARDLLSLIVQSGHRLLLSHEILFELARVLRYPRLKAFYGIREEDVFY